MLVLQSFEVAAPEGAQVSSASCSDAGKALRKGIVEL